MRTSRYLWIILIVFFLGLIYMMIIIPPTSNVKYHCGWNGDIYIKCSGEKDMDLLMVKYGK